MTASDDREKNKIAPATSLGGAPPQTGFTGDDAHGSINTMARPGRQAGIGIGSGDDQPMLAYLLVLRSRKFG
jgi:hypothetical protein